jgi:hypothetical protein
MTKRVGIRINGNVAPGVITGWHLRKSVRLPLTIGEDARYVEISLIGVGLIVTALAHCVRTESDGWISDAGLRRIAAGHDATALIAAAVNVGLLAPVEHGGIAGYQLAADLVARQRSHAQCQRERSVHAAAQRRHHAARAVEARH